MQSANVDARFVYNESGLRVQKIVNGVVTDYVLHGKNVVHMKRGEDELHFFYDVQNRPAIVVYNDVPYAYVKNLQGDVIAILDAAGNVVVSYVYDAWGAPIGKSGSMAETLGTVQPFRYRGYVFDEETGLYYLRSRYYNPCVQRFVNADIAMHRSLFTYCCNTPVNCFDNDGYDAIWITDTDGIGHSSVLIQDATGNWHYYYWGAARGAGSLGSASMISNSSSGMRGNVSVIYEPITLDIGDGSEANILHSLNAQLSADDHKNAFHYKGAYERATYLEGDFTVAHEQALYNKKHAEELVYDVIDMNCAQSVARLLMCAYEDSGRTTDVYYKRLTRMWNAFWPVHMHDILDGIDSGDEPVN